MYNIRIQLVCLLLGFAGTAYPNENDSAVIQTQQNKQEIFYIEDNGSALHTNGQSAVDSILVVDPIESFATDTTGAKDKQQVVFFSKEKKADIVKDSTVETNSAITDIVAKDLKTSSIVLASHNAVPIPIEIKHHNQAVVQSDSLLGAIAVGSDYIVKNDKIPDRDEVAKETVQSDEDDYEGYMPAYKRKSAYKNLEEATLASDRLLAQLKKKQLQKDQSSSRSGSLSSRVVRGGDYVRSTAKNDFGSGTNGRVGTVEFDYETDFGNEPTYYINGVRVEKAEVLKLRKRNVLSRTMKLKDTASRNPNGEIWIEVKE